MIYDFMSDFHNKQLRTYEYLLKMNEKTTSVDHLLNYIYNFL